ncbi:MAG: helix-turn-helix domain-containing protein [Thermacetogeniaceae bacterium]|nr:helix-turn-helix domain-containing protein [Syntrophomonadaceae bacterium]
MHNCSSDYNGYAFHRIVDFYTIITDLDCELFLESAKNTPHNAGENVRNPFCRLIRSVPDGELRCRYQIYKAGRQALDLGEPYVFICHAGLLEWAVPLMRGRDYLGVVVGGRVRLWDADKGFKEELRSRIHDLNLDWTAIQQSFDLVAHLKPDRVHTAAQLLFNITCYQMEPDLSLLQRQKKLWNKRSHLAEELSKQKKAQSQGLSIKTHLHFKKKGSKINRDNKPNIEQMEKQLIGRIRMGEISDAKEILNQILGDIFLNENQELNVVKARLLELLTSVGRIAVQKHTPGEDLFELYQDAVQKLQQITDMEGLYSWTVEIFDRLMNTIYYSRDQSKFSIVEQVADYLKKHYTEDININNVAEAVHYSPYYLSRLFKEEIGLTIIEYLTEIRLAAARNLLENTELNLHQIALRSGYQDQSYFSRLFKKHIGITPNEYRRWWRTKHKQN